MASNGNAEASTSKKDSKKKKKEKPVEKLPIEGTPWLRVTTNEGNVFYTNTETKTSVWTVPEEIKDQVEQQLLAQKNGLSAANVTAQAEAARLLQEKEEEMQRLRDELEREREASRKRKLQEEEEEQEQARAQKMAKQSVTVEDSDSENGAEDDQDAGEGQEQAAEEEPEQLEDWQLDELRVKAEMEAELETPAPAPEQTALSSEESIALFRTMLGEKDINPMKPWDMELPKFIGDPRYKGMSVAVSRVELELTGSGSCQVIERAERPV